MKNIPEFIGELAKILNNKKIDYSTFFNEHKEEFNNLINNYII